MDKILGKTYWQASQQKQYGSAKGNTTYMGSFRELWQQLNRLLSGQYLDRGINQLLQEGQGGQKGQEEIVITGPFDLEFGKPYFVSASNNFDRWTYVGKVPEHVRFEFKLGPENSYHENYIVLPLDTNITKASQLCDIRDGTGSQIINQEEFIGWWNVETQEVEYSSRYCSYITQYPQFDFDVEPGKVYKIFVQRNATWQQF